MSNIQITGGGIYAIRNRETDRMYIGSAFNFVTRWRLHRNLLRKGKHHSRILQNSFNKYGEDAFEYSVLEYVDDKSQLLEREQIWLDFFKPYLNVYKFAGRPTGHKLSIETREKMSAAHKGKKRAPFTEEHKARISAAKNKGRVKIKRDPSQPRRLSLEHKMKISLSLMGNKRALGKKYAPGAYKDRIINRAKRKQYASGVVI